VVALFLAVLARARAAKEVRSVVLVELGLVEQRHRAVLEVLDGAKITDVAVLYGVSRKTVHKWLRRYGAEGLRGLADRSSKPESCPHQMLPGVEARVVEMRGEHPGWGPRTIRTHLMREGVALVPGRSSIHRALLRHGLIDPTTRKRGRSDYKRWERSRSMELWQMDIVGRFHLADGTEVKVVTGVDDHSRFCVCARIVARATARPVVAALCHALGAHGVPAQILTDNGKVFTARFGHGPGPVLFDQACTANGISHLLTAPYSPTTTGKVERFHRTLRKDFFAPNDYRFATVAEAQTALDGWVQGYNHDRPHQSLGDRPPVERFRLGGRRVDPDTGEIHDQLENTPPAPVARPAGVTRWADQRGHISLAGFRYRVGASFAGELVEAVVTGGLVQIFHQQVLVATHVQRRPSQHGRPKREVSAVPRARRPASGPSVVRMADGNGSISFAGVMYRAGRMWARQQVTVTLVAGSVQLSVDGKLVRVHPARHDPAKEHGAFATPKGRPRNRRGVA
jgi:transposase InsO family protein